jgi:flagellar motor switch/type III secretory pathway protein FliN
MSVSAVEREGQRGGRVAAFRSQVDALLSRLQAEEDIEDEKVRKQEAEEEEEARLEALEAAEEERQRKLREEKEKEEEAAAAAEAEEAEEEDSNMPALLPVETRIQLRITGTSMERVVGE